MVIIIIIIKYYINCLSVEKYNLNNVRNTENKMKQFFSDDNNNFLKTITGQISSTMSSIDFAWKS